MSSPFRIGFGYDVHRFAEGRKLILGGVEIPHDKGLLGHSDADALSHAIADAILGAAGLPDIGYYFPPSNPEFKNMDSQKILVAAIEEIKKEGYSLVNIDSTVITEQPKIGPHAAAIKSQLSKSCGIPEKRIGVKATTNEKMGPIGRDEGIEVHAVCLLSL